MQRKNCDHFFSVNRYWRNSHQRSLVGPAKPVITRLVARRHQSKDGSHHVARVNFLTTLRLRAEGLGHMPGAAEREKLIADSL